MKFLLTKISAVLHHPWFNIPSLLNDFALHWFLLSVPLCWNSIYLNQLFHSNELAEIRRPISSSHICTTLPYLNEDWPVINDTFGLLHDLLDFMLQSIYFPLPVKISFKNCTQEYCFFCMSNKKNHTKQLI